MYLAERKRNSQGKDPRTFQEPVKRWRAQKKWKKKQKHMAKKKK